MTDQLALALVHRRPMSGDNFMLHSGVRSAVDRLSTTLFHDRYVLHWLRGERSAGKSHLLVYLSEEALQRGKRPALLSADEFECFLERGAAAPQYFNDADLFLVDDIDLYLEKIEPGKSGPFVSFVETCRMRGSPLVLASTKTVSELPCDEHVLSRLVSGIIEEIEGPEDGDLIGLIENLALQRGLRLRDRQIAYLAVRAPRALKELVESLDRLLLRSSDSPEPIDFEDLERAFIGE